MHANTLVWSCCYVTLVPRSPPLEERENGDRMAFEEYTDFSVATENKESRTEGTCALH